MGDVNKSPSKGGGREPREPTRLVFVCKNDPSYTKIEFDLSDTMSMKQFHKSVAAILEIKQPIKKIFRLNGSEVNNIGEVSKNDCLFFSCGEPFYQRSVDSYSIVILGAGGVGKL